MLQLAASLVLCHHSVVSLAYEQPAACAGMFSFLLSSFKIMSPRSVGSAESEKLVVSSRNNWNSSDFYKSLVLVLSESEFEFAGE
jgi:hypothetical protein